MVVVKVSNIKIYFLFFSVLVTSGIEEKTHKNTPQSKLFSRHLTSNCKIIMSSKRDSATNVVSEAVMFTNFAMVDKAVQTDEQTIKQSTKQRPENADAMLNKLTLEVCLFEFKLYLHVVY